MKVNERGEREMIEGRASEKERGQKAHGMKAGERIEKVSREGNKSKGKVDDYAKRVMGDGMNE